MGTPAVLWLAVFAFSWLCFFLHFSFYALAFMEPVGAAGLSENAPAASVGIQKGPADPGEDGLSLSGMSEEAFVYSKKRSHRSYRPTTRPPKEPLREQDISGEENEEGVFHTSQELELAQLIRAAREERPKDRGLWGQKGPVKWHMSSQFVLWGILSAAVLLIMKGATRADEKQKSLDAHRAVLKSMRKKLKESLKLQMELLKEKGELEKQKVSLYKQSNEAAQQIGSLVADLRLAAASTDISGHFQDPAGRGEGETLSLVVPSLENGCKAFSLDQHLALLHQGDTNYQEQIVRIFLKHLKHQKKIFTRLKFDSKTKLDLASAEAWFEKAANSIGIYAVGSSPKQKKIKEETEECANERASKLHLLAMASVMLQKKRHLERQLQQVREAIGGLLKSGKQEDKSKDLSNCLKTNITAAKQKLRELEQKLTGKTQEETLAREAAAKAAKSVPTETALFGDDPQAPVDAPNALQRSLHAQRKLKSLLRTSSEMLAQHEKHLQSLYVDNRAKAKAYREFREDLMRGYQEASLALAGLIAAQIESQAKCQEHMIADAALVEQEQMLKEQLEGVDAWVTNAQAVFGKLQKQQQEKALL